MFFTYSFVSAQVPQKIKVKKQKDQVYFYQKGNKTDTITRTSGNMFYLIVSEAMKGDISVFIENGQLLKTSNDSLYTFKYVKGISYECVFKNAGEGTQNQKPKFEYKVLVNGVTQEAPNTVVIRLKEKDEPGFFIENRFYYKS
ncbi:MAG: hypothetical protein ACXVNO_08030 [Bacteroidia bacterium]